MSNQLPMPTRGPVKRTGVIHPGQQPTMNGISLEYVDDPDREFPAVWFLIDGHYGSVIVYATDANVCGARADLIAAAFNAATAAWDMGFDPIGAVEALPKLLDASMVVGAVLAAAATDLAEKGKHEGAATLTAFGKSFDAALTAARTRGGAK